MLGILGTAIKVYKFPTYKKFLHFKVRLFCCAGGIDKAAKVYPAAGQETGRPQHFTTPV